MKYAAALVAAAGLAGAQSTTKPSASAGPTAAPVIFSEFAICRILAR